MKKLTTIALTLLALATTGCSIPEKTPGQKKREIENKIESRITEFNYKGHQYILYKSSNFDNSCSGMVHDPDCPCHKQQTTEIE